MLICEIVILRFYSLRDEERRIHAAHQCRHDSPPSPIEELGQKAFPLQMGMAKQQRPVFGQLGGSTTILSSTPLSCCYCGSIPHTSLAHQLCIQSRKLPNMGSAEIISLIIHEEVGMKVYAIDGLTLQIDNN